MDGDETLGSVKHEHDGWRGGPFRNKDATNGTKGIATNGARTLLVAPGITTRNKDATSVLLLVAMPFVTSSFLLLDDVPLERGVVHFHVLGGARHPLRQLALVCHASTPDTVVLFMQAITTSLSLSLCIFFHSSTSSSCQNLWKVGLNFHRTQLPHFHPMIYDLCYVLSCY